VRSAFQFSAFQFSAFFFGGDAVARALRPHQVRINKDAFRAFVSAA
jgi:hypothetical protein